MKGQGGTVWEDAQFVFRGHVNPECQPDVTLPGVVEEGAYRIVWERPGSSEN